MKPIESGNWVIDGVDFSFATVADRTGERIQGKAVTGLSLRAVETAVATLEEMGFVVEYDAVYTIWASKEKE